jgi:hypothetical protein
MSPGSMTSSALEIGKRIEIVEEEEGGGGGEEDVIGNKLIPSLSDMFNSTAFVGEFSCSC